MNASPATDPALTSTTTDAVVDPGRVVAYGDPAAPDAVWVPVVGRSYDEVLEPEAKKLAARHAVTRYNTDGGYDRQDGPHADDGYVRPVLGPAAGADRPVPVAEYLGRAAAAKAAAAQGRPTKFVAFYRFRKLAAM